MIISLYLYIVSVVGIFSSGIFEGVVVEVVVVAQVRTRERRFIRYPTFNILLSDCFVPVDSSGVDVTNLLLSVGNPTMCERHTVV